MDRCFRYNRSVRYDPHSHAFRNKQQSRCSFTKLRKVAIISRRLSRSAPHVESAGFFVTECDSWGQLGVVRIMVCLDNGANS